MFQKTQEQPLLKHAFDSGTPYKGDVKQIYDSPVHFAGPIKFNNDVPAVLMNKQHRGSGDSDTATGSSFSGTRFKNLQNLKNLFDAGILSDAEYHARREQLINKLTGTTLTNTRTKTNVNASVPSASFLAPSVINKPPPDFKDGVVEHGIKYVFDIESRKWKKSQVRVMLDTEPFARGKLRLAFHLKVLDSKETFVAKISMDPRDMKEREIYFVDVEMQSLARHYAKKFNAHNPPKKVDFVMAWLLELTDREGSPLCGVERFIHGPYRKHNNNWGHVSTLGEHERNTPQAFSHFSYKCSGGELLICDIQGVSDLYTDPQIHSRDGKGFGKGNLGQKGIDRFLLTHQCNHVCKFFKLEPVQNRGYSAHGTKPMSGHTKIAEDEVPIDTLENFPGLINNEQRVIEQEKSSWCCVLI